MNIPVSTLNKLIEICKDGEHGFRTAADGVKDDELKMLFQQYSRQRAQLVSELQHEVEDLGADPKETGSMTGAVHRGWINIKSAVAGKNEAAVIAECERGEDAAVKTYQEALGEQMPPKIKEIIQRQYAQVKEAHDHIRALEKSSQDR